MLIAELEQKEEQIDSPDDQRTKPRINPRWCFGNPDTFFLDLLMEEEKQG